MSASLTTADRLAALTAKHAATFTRSVQADGAVVITLLLPDGDRFSGKGATTATAVTALEAKMEKISHAL